MSKKPSRKAPRTSRGMKNKAKKSRTYSKSSFVKIPANESRWRLLPYDFGEENEEDVALPSIQVGEHYFERRPYTCPERTDNPDDTDQPRCPLCTVIKKIQKKQDEGRIHLSNEDKRLLKDVKVGSKFYAKVINRADDKPSVQLVALPFSVFEVVSKQILERDENVGHVELGKDLIIDKTERKPAIRTTYNAHFDDYTSPLHENPKTVKRLLKEAENVDFSSVMSFDLEKLKGVARAVEDAILAPDEEEDLYGGNPKKRKKTKKRRKATRAIDDEYEDEDEDLVDDEYDDEDLVDDEYDDEEEEEDEEYDDDEDEEYDEEEEDEEDEEDEDEEDEDEEYDDEEEEDEEEPPPPPKKRRKKKSPKPASPKKKKKKRRR